MRKQKKTDMLLALCAGLIVITSLCGCGGSSEDGGSSAAPADAPKGGSGPVGPDGKSVDPRQAR